MNKKILSLLIVFILLFSIGMVSATENVSDITATNEDDVAISDSSVTSEVLGTPSSDSIYLENSSESVSTYVITNKSFNTYFTDGALNENVTAGSIIDFQGTFSGLNYTVNINKPVSIISSTGDALFDQIGKTANSGGCFHITAGGSGTNVTGLNFVNSAFYVTNASNVIIDNINMMANMRGIGASTGFMCVRGGSTYVTVKNSYFENKGTGSSIVVVAYSDYCVVDNNEIVINGSSGNALYVTTFVGPNGDHDPTGIQLTNNYIHGKASGFCIALIAAAKEILIENNTIDYNGATGISPQTFWTPKSDASFVIINNKVTGGCAFTAPINSFVTDNEVEGTMTVGTNSVAINNIVGGLTVSQANVTATDNIIGDKGVTLNANAKNTTLTNNIITSTVTVKSSGNTIQENIIDSADEYAVDLGNTVDNEVSYNNISAASLYGDEAVKANENNSVHDNGNITNIVTKDNFFYFFDDEGNYKGLNFTDLIFKGEFDEIVDVITINAPLNIVGLDAVLKNIALNLVNDSISISNFTMNLDKAPDATGGSAILVDGNNISLDTFVVSYALNESTDAYIIYAEDIEGLDVTNSEFTFIGATDGSAINNAVHITESADIELSNNTFDIGIPSCYVDWKEIPAGSGNWVKFPVAEGLVFNEIAELALSNNNIVMEYNDIVGSFDSIYAVDIKSGEDVSILNNTIAATGYSYIYGLYLETENGIVDNNQFDICAEGYYANAIEIEASTNTTISNNILNVESTNVSYPVFSGMNGGDLEVEYVANTINSTADIVYGMELCGSFEAIIDNNITVNGNKTTALAIESKKSIIKGNNINALGTDEAPSKTGDAFEAMTAAIHLYSSDALVEDNVINSNSKGIYADFGIIDIESNEINVIDNGGDNSYGIIISKADDVAIVSNNITYVGNTDGSKINNAILIDSCDNMELSLNNIDITIPSCYVDWKEVPAGSGNWVASPVSQGVVVKSDNAVINENNISLEYDGVVGAYDTIYTVTVSSDNATIESNNIEALGHTYIYALQVSGDGLTIKDNNICSESDVYYADGINIEGPASAVVENNIIEATSPMVSYAVYSAMSNGDVKVNYTNNTVICSSPVVYAFSLGGSLENVTENSFVLDGNYTTAIASKAAELIVKNNTVVANATNVGSPAAGDSIPYGTVGVKAVSGNATVTDNDIQLNGPYTVDVVGANALVKDNFLIAESLTGDASVNYDADKSSVYNNTPKMDKYFLNVDDLVKYYGGNESVEIALTDGVGKGIAGQNVTITVNGRTYVRTTNDNGTAKFAINLPVGTYDLSVSYANDVANLTSDIDVIVLSTISGENIVKVFRNGTQYYANFTDVEGNPLANGTMVRFNINGVMYDRKVNENGTARLNINLDQGTYIITAINPLNGEMASNNITVLPKITENSDLVKYYRNDSQYVVRIIGDDGNPVGANETVTFNINGVMYERKTNESGYAKLNINLQPGNYIITAMYGGCNVANNITVKPILNATDVTMKYRDGTQFKASLVDGQGNPYADQNVTFNINGVFYNRETDSLGIAKLNINLMAGEYIITSMYNNAAISNKITISA